MLIKHMDLSPERVLLIPSLLLFLRFFFIFHDLDHQALPEMSETAPEPATMYVEPIETRSVRIPRKLRTVHKTELESRTNEADGSELWDEKMILPVLSLEPVPRKKGRA